MGYTSSPPPHGIHLRTNTYIIEGCLESPLSTRINGKHSRCVTTNSVERVETFVHAVLCREHTLNVTRPHTVVVLLLHACFVQADHQRWVWDAVFSAVSHYLVTASSDKTATLWDVSWHVLLYSVIPPPVRCLAHR